MITPRGGLKSPRPTFDLTNFEPTEFVCHENTVRSKFEKFDSSGLGLNIREALSLVRTYISMKDTLVLGIWHVNATPESAGALLKRPRWTVQRSRPASLSPLTPQSCSQLSTGQAEVLWEAFFPTYPALSSQQKRMMVRQVIALTEKRREELIDVSAFVSWFRDISRSIWREHNANLRVAGNSHVAESPQLTPRVPASTPRVQDASGGLGSGRLRACVHTYLTIFEPV